MPSTALEDSWRRDFSYACKSVYGHGRAFIYDLVKMAYHLSFFVLAWATILLAAKPLTADTESVRYMREHVKFLSGMKPPRAFNHPESLDRAAGYIKGKLKETGSVVTSQDFTAEGRSYRNVLARFPGKSQRRMIVAAHYDVAGPHPGADDNASGVAVLLELAFLLKDSKSELPQNVELAFYSLEEPPFFRTALMGSAVHARSLAGSKTEIELMISLDGVGFYSESPGSQRYPLGILKWFYPDRGNFLGVVGKFGQGGAVRKVRKLLSAPGLIPVEAITGPALLNGIDFSDHLNFWKYGYDAVMVTDTAFYRNPNYHQPTDTTDTLDYQKMFGVARSLASLLESWSQ